MKKPDLDAADIAILMMLQEDAKVTLKEISLRCFLSESATYGRLQHMEATGIIERRTVVLNKREIDMNFVVFVTGRLINHDENSIELFRKAVAGFEEIKECSLTESNNGLLMKVVVKDMVAYKRFYYEKLLSITGITGIQSCSAIEEIKCGTVLKL